LESIFARAGTRRLPSRAFYLPPNCPIGGAEYRPEHLLDDVKGDFDDSVIEFLIDWQPPG